MLKFLLVLLVAIVGQTLSVAETLTDKLLSDPTRATTQSTLAGLDWGHGFGYTGGILMYDPWFGARKGVAMSEQTLKLEYKCSGLIKNTEHVATVVVTTAVNPSLKVESDFHRLVAVYGAVGTKDGNKNVVTADDVKAGATTYLGQYQERLCGLLAGRALKDMLQDPGIGYAEELGNIVKRDSSSPFEVKVQTIRVTFPEELLRAMALKSLEKPKPATKKPVKPKVAKPVVQVQPQQTCCVCAQVCATPAAK